MIFLWSMATVVAAFVVHVAAWRIHLPRKQTRALALIFALTLVAALTAFESLSAAGLSLHLPRGGAQYAQVSLLVIAWALAYIITYSAMEADSPTLVFIRRISAAGPGGLEQKDFDAQVSDDVLVRPRVADLVRDGLLTADGDRYRMTPKGRRFVGIFILYRRILGAGKGG